MKIYLAETYRAHEARITALETLQHRVLISAAEDGMIIAHPFDRSVDDVRMCGHSGAVLGLVAFHESHFFVSASADGTLMIWNADSGECVRTLSGHEGPVTAVTVADEGRVIVSGGADGTLRFWETLTGALCSVGEGSVGPVTALEALPYARGHVLAVTQADPTGPAVFHVWDGLNGQRVRTLEPTLAGLSALALLPEGRLYAGSVRGDVTYWDIHSGQKLNTQSTQPGSTVLALFPDGQHVVLAAPSPQLSVWDLRAARIAELLDEPNQSVSRVIVTPDGRRVIVGCTEGTLHAYRVSAS